MLLSPSFISSSYISIYHPSTSVLHIIQLEMHFFAICTLNLFVYIIIVTAPQLECQLFTHLVFVVPVIIIIIIIAIMNNIVHNKGSKLLAVIVVDVIGAKDVLLYGHIVACPINCSVPAFLQYVSSFMR